MFEIVSTDGCLLIARFSGVVTEDAMSHCIQAVRAVITKGSEQGVQMICVTDVREVVSFTTGARDVLVWLLRRDNVAKTVNAFMARGAAGGNLAEITDVLRQGQSDLRHAFTDEAALLAWVAPRLGEVQQQGVVTFLRRPLVPLRPTSTGIPALRPTSTGIPALRPSSTFKREG